MTYGTGESYIYIKVRNYNLMASCGFAHLIVGRWCGSSADNPANVQCVVVGANAKSTQGRLRNFSYLETLP